MIWSHSFFNRHRTPDIRGIAPIMPARYLNFTYQAAITAVIIRLKARIWSNIGFTPWGNLAVFMHLVITLPKVNWCGWNLQHSEYLVGGWPWQILDTIRAVATVCTKEILSLCPINNVWFHRYVMNTFRTEFWKFYHKGSFFKKKSHKVSTSYDFRPP